MKETAWLGILVTANLLFAGLQHASAQVEASGGNVTNASGPYRIHIFTNSGTFTVASGGNVAVLVVAGGGGGGGGTGGGGGGGGVIYDAAFHVLSGSNYTVTVGAGGVGGSGTLQRGTNGGNSVFATLTAIGGGGGGCNSTAGLDGGSGGGGGGGGKAGGTGTSGQGFAGGGGGTWSGNYPTAGGGGAGTNGEDAISSTTPGAGGVGVANAISGTTNWYAGGGGGGVYQNSTGAAGGQGGGGHGGCAPSGTGTTGGSPTTGGGGGGGGNNQSAAAGSGGSGIVIVRYLGVQTPEAPAIENCDPANVTSTSATFNAYLSLTNGSPATVSVFWGESAGTGPGTWAHTNAWPQGFWLQDDFPTTNMVGLSANATYYYAFYATNAAGETTALPPVSFITGSVTIQGGTNGSEVGPVNGSFTVYRPAACTNENLSVQYDVDTTVPAAASNGVDYATLSGQVTIPAGQTSATIAVQVVQDTRTEPTETVRLVLAGGAYPIGSPDSAAITIADGPSAGSGRVWWRDRDGNTGALTNVWWTDVAYALQAAQVGSTGTGIVKICGDIMRTNLDVAGSLAITNGGYVNVSGGWNSDFTAQSGKSRVDARGYCRVFLIGATNVVLSNLILTGGTVNDTSSGAGVEIGSASTPARTASLIDCVISNNATLNGYSGAGAGVTVNFADDVLLLRCDIVNNAARADGGGLLGRQHIGDAGKGVVIDSCVIRSNSASFGSGGGVYLGFTERAEDLSPNRVLIVNSAITSNRAVRGAGVRLSDESVSSRVVLHDCLIQGNRQSAINTNSYGMGILKSGKGSAYIVNSTVADNINTADARLWGVFVDQGWYGSAALRVINSVVASNNGVYANGAASLDYFILQHTTIREPRYDQGTYDNRNDIHTLVPTATTNSFAGALTFATPHFSSLNETGAVTQGIEQNLETDPLFAGAGKTPYQLTLASPCVNSGLATNTGSYTYVDVNGNGTYDPRLDIIVAGTPPAGTNFVYALDLLGAPRIKTRRIDRGAYEFVSSGGTMVLFL